MSDDKPGKKRGPRGSIKHQPGRGHDHKSAPARKKRFARKAERKRLQDEDDARRQWDEWDRLPDDVKKLLGSDGQPKLPRPQDD